MDRLRRDNAYRPAPIVATTITMIVMVNGTDDAAGGTAGTLVAVGAATADIGVTAAVVVAAKVAVAGAVVEVAAEGDVATAAVDATTNTAAVRPGTVNVPESILKSAVRTTESLDAC
jgi:hypothetical protein